MTTFVSLHEGWTEHRPADAATKRRLAAERTGDPPDDASPLEQIQHYTDPKAARRASTAEVIYEGEHLGRLADLSSLPGAGQGYAVFPNRCSRCPANYPRRGEKLWPLLDLVAKAGRDTVTLRELAAIGRAYDTRN
ncbi:hypothetical protein H5397_12685 [Propioniciclava sp. MC1683]|uniref:hypothetical protein n=1 Tax=Propioniciclava sp. MC1683 TaxID=2760309 RepID=UPI0016023BDC|nr:hypothetical protein [Propioniciclava sp. MC1683]MBB1502269.1 hypothetical protein [Propioniciclava sp. MC1683]